MIFTSLLIAASTFAGLAVSQNTTNDYTVDPNSVDRPIRISWCRAQQNTCPMICNGRPADNDCDADTLEWKCTCTGSSPNITDFDQTLPSLECGVWRGQCVERAGSDLAQQTDCLSVVCGNRNASENVVTTTSTTTTSEAAATSTAASETADAPAETSSGAAVPLAFARDYGTPALAAGLLGIFGFVL
ncbi:hypothetical protein M501DRAFT_924197 [Patellaria atrata CBS 101060]|uniref:DUF7707 domain-containing protein n=1 Tax=Patellaria atrata CBS 101060 TaxID=1346257 RepID=A0A9P4SI52_9PEZI|nr:hypothetical protein M501DRAFT_924197 [Patellaria atrata CBS 101060]